jgi:hypothetical protein
MNKYAIILTEQGHSEPILRLLREDSLMKPGKRSLKGMLLI